jgi:hypothetical protein
VVAKWRGSWAAIWLIAACVAACQEGGVATDSDAVVTVPCPATCDDENPCTEERCTRHPWLGCEHIPVADGTPCAGWCVGSTCASGACVTKLADCDDNNECTIDSCDSNGSCQHRSILDGVNSPCLDTDDCTQEVCLPGVGCQHLLTIAGERPSCTDDDPCTFDACVPDQGCVHDGSASGIAKSCDDGVVCTLDGCTAMQGCENKPNPVFCADNDFCTMDACVPGVGCNNPPLCDDGDPCTADTCDPNTAKCTHQVINCDDGELCTVDKCPKVGGCAHVHTDSPCNDGIVCTVDTCKEKVGCQFVPSLFYCSDGEFCTTDSCNPASGCVFLPLVVACTDGTACTVDDTCTQGKCLGKPLNCDDSDVCTIDSCDTKSGCAHLAKCDDGDACTTDTCSATGECTHVVLAEGSICNACSGAVCLAGACTGDTNPCFDSDPCTKDTCDAAAKKCVHTVQACSLPTQASSSPDYNNTCQSKDDCPCDGCQGYDTYGGSGPVCDDVHVCHIKQHCTSHEEYVGYGCVAYASMVCDGSGDWYWNTYCYLAKCVAVANYQYACGACGPNSSGKGYCPFCNKGKCQLVEEGPECTSDKDCSDAEYCSDHGCKPDTCNGGACVGDKWPNGGTCYACAPNGSALMGNPIDCNDKDLCTTETWSPATGCVHTPKPEGEHCGPFWAGQCKTGVCVTP